MKLCPYVLFAGNAEEALNFYKEVFGGKILMISRFGEAPQKVDDDWKQKIMHSRLEFDGNILMISDGFKGYQARTDGNIQLSVEIDTVEKLNVVFAKMSEGGRVTMPLAKQFWGATFGMLQDKFGISWMFNCEDKK